MKLKIEIYISDDERDTHGLKIEGLVCDRDRIPTSQHVTATFQSKISPEAVVGAGGGDRLYALLRYCAALGLHEAIKSAIEGT